MQVFFRNMQLFLKICNYYALMQIKFLKGRIVYVIIHVFHAQVLLFKKCIFRMRIKFMQESEVYKLHISLIESSSVKC